MSQQQTKLIHHWESKGFFVVNNVRTNKTGMPDLTASKPNKTIYIESKEKNDSLNPNQIARLNQLSKLGFDCFVNFDKWTEQEENDTNLF